MRTIDADHLIESIKRELTDSTDGSYMFQRFVDEEPTVDPVKHARWINIKYKGVGMYPHWYCECSICRHTNETLSKYCPECGAEMDKWIRR